MTADAGRIELAYRYSAAAYWFLERQCHDNVDERRARQRDVTRWSLEIVRGVRPDVQAFTNLLVQFPREGVKEPAQTAPDTVVFHHERVIVVGNRYDVPLQHATPFLVADYTETSTSRDEAGELNAPYYLHSPTAAELSVFRLGDGEYTAVRPNAAGRHAMPELELEVGLLGEWVRYWFRGELVPLPGDVLAELAKLREELAKAKKQ